MRKIYAAFAAAALAAIAAPTAPAQAQSACKYTSQYGYIPSVAEWTWCWQSKQDVLLYTPVNRDGDTMLGRLVLAPPTATRAGVNIPMAGVPSAPADGDVWITTAGMFARINGATIGPLASFSNPPAQAANAMFAGPTTGANAPPTFRALVNADLPPSPSFVAPQIGDATATTVTATTAGTEGTQLTAQSSDASTGRGGVTVQNTNGGGALSIQQAASGAAFFQNFGTADTVDWFDKAGNSFARFTGGATLADTHIDVLSTKPSTSSTTGALTVAGGIGVSGDVYVGGVANVGGAADIGGNVNIGGTVDIVGIASAQTPTAGDISTKLATTAFVNNAMGASGGLSTGDVKFTIKSTADAGWVMMDDGTIGSASSGGSTRANSDCQALFTLLWNNISDTYAPVAGGRGASAAADWAANKTISLPKTLGRALAVAGSGSGLTTRALGQTFGNETHSMTAAENGPHTHSGSFSGSASVSTSLYTFTQVGGSLHGLQVDAATPVSAANNGSNSASSASLAGSGSASGSISVNSSGSGTPFSVVDPTTYLHVMVKL